MNNQNLFSFILFSLLFTCHASPVKNRTKRISNGFYDEEAVRLGKYVVSIRTRNAQKYFGDNHFCSGVILAPKFVLTSVHCLINHRRVFYDSRVYLIVAGTTNRLKYVPHRTFVTLVKKIFVPVNFTMYNKQDVGLLHIKTPFPRDNDYIRIAKLPVAPPPAGLHCEVMGWGRLFPKPLLI
ncbi:snake venom serine proteinase 12-like isoform X2 [Drosophila ficusphila]|uniref:snake venom serine proteinase 12-like isoform X2 n=1 Tax=Drosophila ficusphila TaxID=30025 RepID=UPI0007E81A7B|nr:snake venom serine proteinase 12-like isoform X2 [Drosophila ficusphila]